MWSRLKRFNVGTIILIVLAAIAARFLIFTLGYWVITLILAAFFNFILPFSWGYAFGAWLIWLIVIAFLSSVLKITVNNG